jgi:spermidine synthase
MQRRIWLARNRAVVLDRLNWLDDQPDGLLHMEESAAATLIVTKIKFDIYLRMVEPARPDFSLVQSQLNLKQPFFLTPRYKQAMLLSLAWLNNPGRACLVGLGGGRLPLVLHHYLPALHLDCVEIDPAVLAIASRFFGFQPDDRLTITVGDGYGYLSQVSQPYDVLFIDAFQANGDIPAHLAIPAFFELCRSRLAKRGVLTINLLDSDPCYPGILDTLQAIFDPVYVCSLLEGNRVIFAVKGFPGFSPAELAERARQVQNYHQFSFPFVKRATELKTADDLLTELDGPVG